ncbi:MAG: hypothetical protein IJT85_03795 [Ruminococcus sp.]|nr:hypothetical protein [Ruminococcus sp.]
MNKKFYAEPELELVKFNFQSIMDGEDPGEAGHGIVHSIGEGGAIGGGEGAD